jgi:hypothetical protein
VALDQAGERAPIPGAFAVEPQALRGHLAGLAQAGADEAILVVDPITETSIRSLGTVIPTA